MVLMKTTTLPYIIGAFVFSLLEALVSCTASDTGNSVFRPGVTKDNWRGRVEIGKLVAVAAECHTRSGVVGVQEFDEFLKSQGKLKTYTVDEAFKRVFTNGSVDWKIVASVLGVGAVSDADDARAALAGLDLVSIVSHASGTVMREATTGIAVTVISLKAHGTFQVMCPDDIGGSPT
jgi:hypothetical protein